MNQSPVDPPHWSLPPEPQSPGWKLRAYVVPCATAVLCVVLALGGDPWRQWGRYEREGLQAGQWWRLASGHLVHLGWSHLALNLTALAMLVALSRASLTMLEWLLLLVSSMLLIDIGLYVFEADVAWYVGLSGILHGVTVVVAGRLWRADPWSGGMLCVALAAKILAEQMFGPSTWSVAASGGPVVAAAHLYGAIGGLFALLAIAGLRRRERDILGPPDR